MVKSRLLHLFDVIGPALRMTGEIKLPERLQSELSL